MSSGETPVPPYNASDPFATFLNSSCMDLLTIELVPMAHRLAGEVSVAGPGDNAGGGVGAGGAGAGGGTAVGGGGGGGGADDEDEYREAAYRRLEGLGYRVGQGMAERFSRDRPRFTDTLDVIKFLCKDMWMLMFRKQIDNLKTNHRGVYVLTDNSFKPFSRMSMVSPSEAVVKAQPYLWFPCGVIRGSLATLGINVNVQAETSELPAATFQIKTIPTKR